MSVEDKVRVPGGVSAIRAVPRSVVALGLVSLFMDISSEIIHSLLPVFLVAVLGASALSVGFIEGIAEAASQVSKLFAGAISDWVGKRKPLVLIGYGLSALTKPLFPLASGVGVVVAARFIDRIGKGIRGAPRDALIGDVTPVELRGTAFGLRQAMDTVGAFIGPLLAMLLMAASSDNFRLVFWVAVLPAIIAVVLTLYGVQEPDVPRSRAASVPDPASRIATLGWRLLVACRDRHDPHLRAIQRGVPVARCRARRARDSADPWCVRRYECRLRGERIPVWPALGCRQSATASGIRGRLPDRGGHHPGDRQHTAASRRGRCFLGFAHGSDARAVVNARRRCRSRRSQAHGARNVQSDNWRRVAAGERSSRLAVGRLRSPCDLYRRRRIRWNCPHRYAVLARRQQVKAIAAAHSHRSGPAIAADAVPPSLETGSVVSVLAPGHQLFRQGDLATAVYKVESGRLRLIRRTVDDHLVILHTARQGEFFAEASLFAESYHSDAVAAAQSRVRVYPKAIVMKALSTDPALAEAFMARLAHQLQELRADGVAQRPLRPGPRASISVAACRRPGSQHCDRGPVARHRGGFGITRQALYRTLAALEVKGYLTRTEKSDRP
jgi:CRP-like cAMP-binding protein